MLKFYSEKLQTLSNPILTCFGPEFSVGLGVGVALAQLGVGELIPFTLCHAAASLIGLLRFVPVKSLVKIQGPCVGPTRPAISDRLVPAPSPG